VPTSDLDLNTRFAPTTPTKQRLFSVDSAPTAVDAQATAVASQNMSPVI